MGFNPSRVTVVALMLIELMASLWLQMFLDSLELQQHMVVSSNLRDQQEVENMQSSLSTQTHMQKSKTHTQLSTH